MFSLLLVLMIAESNLQDTVNIKSTIPTCEGVVLTSSLQSLPRVNYRSFEILYVARLPILLPLFHIPSPILQLLVAGLFLTWDFTI